MSELPFMTVYQVLSLLEPCYERQLADLLDPYTTDQLMCWHVIQRADKRLAGTSAVQTFIYQFVVRNRINRLTVL